MVEFCLSLLGSSLLTYLKGSALLTKLLESWFLMHIGTKYDSSWQKTQDGLLPSRVTDSSTEAFILRLYRQENKVRVLVHVVT